MVRQLLTGTAAVAIAVAISGPVSAADMPVKAAPYAVARPAIFDWSGFYVGGHIGYGSSGFASVDSQPELGTKRGTGWLGGGQLGYNVQSGNIVWGVEADITGTSLKKFLSDNKFKTDLLASIRARLGIAVDRVLVYATGGWGYVRGKVYSSVTTPTTSFGKGVPVIGVGFEVATAPNVTWRIEALDFVASRIIGGEDTGGNRLKSTYEVRLGLNWKFDSGKAPVVAKY